MKPFPIIQLLVFVGMGATTTGCYIYHERSKVLLPDVDIDQSLDVAALELQKNERTRVLTIWALRDQVLTPPQAQRISDLYFEHIDAIDSDAQKSRGFAVWHLTWAISNIYRHGGTDIKEVMAEAYRDAANRVEALDMKIATTHFHDQDIYMGDGHFLGRSYAKSHLVVPGNEDYLQSLEEYKQAESD